ncbi:MAG: DUF3105 domain-containing protein [Actinomycetota bacterium]
MAKKKRKRKPQAGAGVDAEQKRRERLEARRQAKAEEFAAQQRAARRRRVVRLLAYAGLVVALVWFFFIRGQTPDEIGGHRIQKFVDPPGARDHVSGTVNYETTPPVSGPHAGQPFPCGVHGQPIPNENFVHSLEHGAVAILYQPDLDIDTVREIESIVGEYEDNVLSAPYPGMEPTIVVASWGEKMNLDEIDGPAIREYADVFRGRGPEGIDCPSDADQPFQPAPAETLEATPSPEPTES